MRQVECRARRLPALEGCASLGKPQHGTSPHSSQAALLSAVGLAGSCMTKFCREPRLGSRSTRPRPRPHGSRSLAAAVGKRHSGTGRGRLPSTLLFVGHEQAGAWNRRCIHLQEAPACCGAQRSLGEGARKRHVGGHGHHDSMQGQGPLWIAGEGWGSGKGREFENISWR